MSSFIFEAVAKVATYWNENAIYVALGLIAFSDVIVMPITKDVFKAFFAIEEDESLLAGSKKIGKTISGRFVYLCIDWWTVIISAAMVGLLNKWQWSFLNIVLATWVFDFVIAVAFMIGSEKSGQDITLGNGLRRAADVVRSASKLVGYAMFLFLALKATIWEGPEQIVIFFKKELRTMSRMAAVLLGLTFVQGAFWAFVYSLGYKILNY